MKTASARINKLLAWYDAHRRDLPWRAGPGVLPDPYHVWLSEIMLQQTVVATVIPYFEAFLKRWPRVVDLAAADLDNILAAWAGLGYYARARNLHACAQRVVADHNGRFPKSLDELQSLPGIGPYTAAAIGAIAFNIPVMPVDGNIERVAARLDAIDAPLPGAKAMISEVAQTLISHERPGDMAQALMDLGASLCAPLRPKCSACPLGKDCSARKLDIAASLPVKAPKKIRPLRVGTIFWIERGDGLVLLRQRPPTGLLGGMSEFPSTPWIEGEAATSLAVAMPDCSTFHDLECEAQEGVVRHIFTHFTLELTLHRVTLPGGFNSDFLSALNHYRWVQPSHFHEAALPSVMKKVASQMLD